MFLDEALQRDLPGFVKGRRRAGQKLPAGRTALISPQVVIPPRAKAAREGLAVVMVGP